jgi:hypothetical protein
MNGKTRIKKYQEMRYGERPLIAKNTTGPIMTPISLSRDERGYKSPLESILGLKITLLIDILSSLKR